MLSFYTKQEIEELGFIYEPDESKCKLRKTRIHLDCNYVKNGVYRNPPIKELTKERKDSIVKILMEECTRSNWSHIHLIGTSDLSDDPPMSNGVLCRSIMVKGHA